MSRRSIQEKEMLGVSICTARRKLYTAIIWDLAKRHNENVCYRCGTVIQEKVDFSIDHIEDWRYAENAKELYFDIHNIKFSHLRCNGLAHRGTHVVKSKCGYKGVEFRPGRAKGYRANIGLNGKVVKIGSFNTAIEAAKAYDRAAIDLHGNKAVTNQMLGLV